MPYKVSGKKVLVKRGRKWKVLKVHPSRRKASAHMAALRRNVGHGK